VIAVFAVVCVCAAGIPSARAQHSGYKIRVDVVERVTNAINYQYRSGPTTVGFRGTFLEPGARGEAQVESKKGYTEIDARIENMIPANRYGRQYLTYVLWAVTPDGRSSNLGELILRGNKAKLDVTTGLQTFGMVVTAEPYFAVTQPSDRVVVENFVRPDTAGGAETINARYELSVHDYPGYETLPRRYRPQVLDSALPLDLQEAQNAVRIAEWFGAREYARDAMFHAEDLLDQAEQAYVRKSNSKEISTVAREAVQRAEDARLIAMSDRGNNRNW
jgi:hypothetical protein